MYWYFQNLTEISWYFHFTEIQCTWYCMILQHNHGNISNFSNREIFSGFEDYNLVPRDGVSILHTITCPWISLIMWISNTFSPLFAHDKVYWRSLESLIPSHLREPTIIIERYEFIYYAYLNTYVHIHTIMLFEHLLKSIMCEIELVKD